MSRNAVVSGWCPVHDRVYEHARDGLCPECGTELVRIDEAGRHRDDVEVMAVHAPPATSPALRFGVAAAVVGAFVLGLAFPRGGGSTAERKGRSPAPVSQDVRVGSVARAAGGSMRLDRVIRDGDRFSATFVGSGGFPPASLVKGVSVEIVARTGSGSDVYGVSDVDVAPSGDGFVIHGRLEPGTGRITEMRLSSVQMAVTAQPVWRVDLDPIWPVRGAEPAVMHIGESRPVGPGTVRLVSILSWDDRLEMAFELRGLRSTDMGTFTINELEIESNAGSGAGRSVLPAVSQEQVSPGQIVARFEGVPSGIGTVTIRASRLSAFLAGPWSWKIG